VETIHPPQEMKWASSKACRAKNLQVSAMGSKADVGRSSGTTRPASLAASAGRLPGVSAHNSGEVVGVQVRAPDAGDSMAVRTTLEMHGARLSEEHMRLIDR